MAANEFRTRSACNNVVWGALCAVWVVLKSSRQHADGSCSPLEGM
mgnify:CR=1 FL=1